MPVLDRLTASELRRSVVCYRDVLRAHRDELNRMNVYPVPDGDTGTNMALTVESVLQELDGTQSLDEVCRALAHGSLMGARGNSGVILSQILRGLAESWSNAEAVDGARLADGLARAARAAYEAVMRPVEGTILTVVRECSEAASSCGNGEAAALLTVLETSRAAAGESLARTPELLPVLKQAGVVDAGAKGFVLFLDTLLHVVDGRSVPEPEVAEAPAMVRAHAEAQDVSTLRYEVMYLLDADDSTIHAFKDCWATIGDSIVVVGGDGLWNCHIHTDDIGAAVEAGIDAGRPRNVRVTDLLEQVEEERWVREQEVVAQVEAPLRVTTAVVAVAVGRGLQRLFTGLGAARVIAGGQTMNPSTQQILEAVEACPADQVIVLPNNKNIVPVAMQVDELTAKRVEVVPTISVVEGLSALVSYDPQAPIDVNLAAVSEASARVRTGEVTRAIRDAPSDLGPISEGDWIALDRDGIRAIASSAGDALLQLVDVLVGDDGELVTIVLGGDADPAETTRLEEQLSLAHPGVEIELHDGGQPLYPYLVGVE